MSKALFKGSTSHELSQKEEEAFWNRLSISGRLFSFGDEAEIEAGIKEMLKTPTGREQAREIINHEPKDYKFKIDVYRGLYADLKANQSGGRYVSTLDHVEIYPHGKNPQELGQSLFHEMMHARQPHDPKTDSKVLSDTETQALSSQLSYEAKIVDGNNMDTEYNKSYEFNLQKWRKIAKNPRLTPKGEQSFEPVNGLTKEELAQAREQYARQMASKETRVQYIKDFMKDPLSNQHDMVYSSSFNREFRSSYRLQDISIFNQKDKKGNRIKYPEDVRFDALQERLKNKYGLKDSDFSELARFYQAYDHESKDTYPHYKWNTSEFLKKKIDHDMDNSLGDKATLQEISLLREAMKKNPNDVNEGKLGLKALDYAYKEGTLPDEFYVKESCYNLWLLKGKIPEKEYQAMEKEFLNNLTEAQKKQKTSQNNKGVSEKQGASSRLRANSRNDITAEASGVEEQRNASQPKRRSR